MYHRAPAYLLSNLMPACLLFMDIGLLIQHRERFSRRVRRAFWVYFLVPLAAMGIASNIQAEMLPNIFPAFPLLHVALMTIRNVIIWKPEKTDAVRKERE